MQTPMFLGLPASRHRASIDAMNGFTYRHIDQLSSILHGAVKLVGDELGVQTFGLQILDLPAGFADYPAHDHAEDRQEEVYVVLAGSAEFTVGGEEVRAPAGGVMRVEPGVMRAVIPGPEGARILAIGRPLDGAYERPQDFRVGVRA